MGIKALYFFININLRHIPVVHIAIKVPKNILGPKGIVSLRPFFFVNNKATETKNDTTNEKKIEFTTPKSP